jgi:hypothetical protein
MAGLPVTDTERDQIRTLHARGLSRNEIAKQLGRSVGTVTAHCKAMSLPFDRAATQSATEARVADMRAWRTRTQAKLAAKYDGVLASWDEPSVVFNIGGSGNVYTEHEMPEPPAETRNVMARTMTLLLEQQLKLLAVDAAKDNLSVNSVDEWLDSLTAGSGH